MNERSASLGSSPVAVESPSGARRTEWFRGAILVAVTLVAYAPVWRAGFIWDDPRYVSENPLLRAPGGLAAIWAGRTIQYYPLVFTSFWLEWRLWGDSATGYHIVNVLLHALNAMFVFRILRRLNVPGAFTAAAIFALHPVQVESAAWITERKNVLSGLFYLAALEAWLRYEESREGRRYAASLLLFALAMLSKTVTCSLPVVMVILHGWRGRRWGWREAGLLAPFFVVGATLGLLTVWYEWNVVGARGAEWDLTPAGRVLVAGRALWFYVGKLVWPATLTFIYPRWDIDPGQWRQWLWAMAAVGVGAGLWVLRARVGRGPAAAGAFFGVTLFPALGFIDVFPMRYSYVADHFQYLASLGPIVLAVGAAAVAASRWRGLARAAPLAASVVPAALGVMTFRQARIYESLDTLWADTLRKNPGCQMAHHNLGNLLAERGDLAGAIEHYDRALALSPRDPETLFCKGNALRTRGDTGGAAALYRRVIEVAPGFAPAHNNLGALALQAGRLDEAVEHFRGALEAPTPYGLARVNLARALALRAVRHEEADRREEARRDAAEARELVRGTPAPDVAAVLERLDRRLEGSRPEKGPGAPVE